MPNKGKVKTSLRLDPDLWERFIAKVIKTRGKTSGGAITESLEEALELWLKQK
jgi:hypothetical protein